MAGNNTSSNDCLNKIAGFYKAINGVSLNIKGALQTAIQQCGSPDCNIALMGLYEAAVKAVNASNIFPASKPGILKNLAVQKDKFSYVCNSGVSVSTGKSDKTSECPAGCTPNYEHAKCYGINGGPCITAESSVSQMSTANIVNNPSSINGSFTRIDSKGNKVTYTFKNGNLVGTTMNK